MILKGQLVKMENENLGAKATVFKLLKEGLTYENIREETGLPIKVLIIWHIQNEEYKKEKLEMLGKLLQFCSESTNPIFSVGERIMINQERAILLRDEVLTKNFRHSKTLTSKINFHLDRIKNK
ncbi:hypothetical protein [Flavobacterium johnsoniae]|uniref:Uncharacterized protein n=1 Tax=Flavobacterium johnsoniae TaxID=986 RepID=A0A1M5IXP0_FLAJO|nr:hypothetical protein [Flavobacterium johnsoniae]SHG33066.1 hypothetical protein SAMN05444388_102296 [Flavobacterium johnsoniae]